MGKVKDSREFVLPTEIAEADVELLRNPAAGSVWDWLAERYGDRRLTPDSSFRLDLDVDSLEWLTITMEINRRAGVDLTEEAVGRIEAVRDLLTEVSKGNSGEGGLARARPLEEPEEVIGESGMRWLAPLGPVMGALSWLLVATITVLVRLLFRLSVSGIENVPDRGPYLLAPNHVSYLDPPVVGSALGGRRVRSLYWAGWTGVVFTNPLTRLFSRLVRVVPIDPDRAVASSLAFGAAVLRRGKALALFPEGQRSPTGRIQPFKAGAGVLLGRFRVPVVPVYIRGAYEALPLQGKIPRLRRISVAFGAPLDPAELEREGRGDTPHERITAALHDRMAAVLLSGRERVAP